MDSEQSKILSIHVDGLEETMNKVEQLNGALKETLVLTEKLEEKAAVLDDITRRQLAILSLISLCDDNKEVERYNEEMTKQGFTNPHRAKR